MAASTSAGPAHADPAVVVIGAGIAGLAAAFRLSRAGLTVTVLERSTHVGGKMLSMERKGFVLNRAATIIPSSYTALSLLAADAGISNAFTPTSTSFGVLHEGRVRTLRGDGLGAVLDAVRTDLLSPRSKLRAGRLGADARRWRRALPADDFEAAGRLDTESVAAYARRRLNRELYDNLIDPLMRGLYLADPADMSVVDLALTLGKFAEGGLTQYPTGISFLPQRLAAGLDIRLGVTVERVEHDDHGVHVTWRSEEQTDGLTARSAVIAVPTQHLARIYPDLTPRQRELVESIDSSAILKGIFALRRLPEGTPTVSIVPTSAGIDLGIALVDTRSMPQSAPPGKAVMSGHWVDSYARANHHRSDEDLLDEMVPEMEAVVPGFTAALEFGVVERWPAATIANRTGFHRTVAEFRRSLDPADPVQLAGDYFTIPSTNNSALSGERAASRLIARLRRSSAQPAAPAAR